MYDPVEILLVEDNPNDAELTIRALKKNGLANELVWVEDGQEALDFIYCQGRFSDRVNQRSLKVVFLDLKLPKISGLEVLQTIKSNPDTKRIPVVVISSSNQDPDIARAYDLGANSYVVKPVNFEDFMNALQSTGLFWLLVNQTRL